MTSTPVSPETGKDMVRETRPLTITYKGQSATFDMPGWYCQDTGEGIHTEEDQKVSDEALRDLKIRVENLLPSEEVRRIRKKLALTQREAGAIVGGGPNAFQKYESGEVLASKAMSNLLRVLEKHPEDVEELKRA